MAPVSTVACGNDNVGDLLWALLKDAEAALIECERPVGLVSLAPGNTVSWDNCCASGPDQPGGQLWVRLISIVPQPQGSQTCDVTSNQLRIGVGVVRCMHGITEDRSPTAEEMSADTLGTTADANVLQQALRCSDLVPSANKKSFRFEQGLPQGPQGNCGGFEWTVTVQIGLCKPCA